MIRGVVEPLERPGAIGEPLDRGADAVEHRHVQVAERRVLAVDEVPTRRQRAAGPAGQHGRQVVRVVLVAVAQGRAEQHHRVVQQRPFPFADLLHPVEQLGALLDVPGRDPLVLVQLLGVVLVVRELVVAPLDALDEREVLVADRVAEHERGDPRRVGLEGQQEDVEHQPDVLGVVHRPLADAAGVVLVEVDPAAEGLDVLAGLGVVDVAGAAVAGLEGDPRLDGADRVEVLVELAAVVLADPVAQGAGVVGHEVEDAPIVVAAGALAGGRSGTAGRRPAWD